MRLPGAFPCILVACGGLLAQDPAAVRKPDTSYLPCSEIQSGTRSMDGPVLRSTGGNFAAYVHAEAVVKAPAWTDCLNTTSLLVKTPGESKYQTVYVKKPESSLQGNGLKLIGWSHKGHILAAELTLWQYESDFGGLSIVLYDADRKRAWEPDLAALFSKRFGKECAFAIPKVIGFDDQDRVLFEAGDYYEEGDDEPVPDTRCLGHPGIWALNAGAGELSEVRGVSK